MERLLTIGEFAERCGLSRSALRFYDQNELLAPTLVDEESGYRYYAAGQVQRAALVRQLRAAEMPVEAVRRYLEAGTGERRAVLEAHLASFRERATAVEAVVDGLRRELDDEARLAGIAGRCAVDPGEFAAALDQVRFAVADPAERAELGVVWIETAEGALRLVATDSYRLAVRDLVPQRIESAGLRGAIDAARVNELVAELSTAGELVLRQGLDGGITAAVDGHDTGSIGHDGQGFPDYQRILTELPATHHTALGRAAIRAALVDLAPETPELCLDFQPEQLTLHSASRNAALAARWSGPPLRVFLNSRFFIEAVTATVGPDLVIEASGELNPVILRAADAGTFSVLTMPVRQPQS